MSLGSKFLSRKFSKSVREHDRKAKEKEEEERAAAVAEDHSGTPYGTTWSTILPELLREIIKRLEATDDLCQRRQNVVASAGVCQRWREITKETFYSHLRGGTITFPSCLKQPGPSGSLNQCLIRRNKKTSTFCLYLARSPSLTDKGKFLLAARRYRRASHIEYIISLHDDDYSQRSNAYVGKLSSDFLGTNFTIYESKAPHNSGGRGNRGGSWRFSSKQISPQLPVTNYEVGRISYKFNLLKSRGPRRMVCSIKYPPPPPTNEEAASSSSTSGVEEEEEEEVVLKNKAPRWHEQLQCWCLNFHGRVTVASVKNFQLVSCSSSAATNKQEAAGGGGNNKGGGGGGGDEDTVLLQFGRVDEDLFTMDYRHPLSPFQAFAICLTSFGTKIACE